MTLQVFNTLTRKKEDFNPITPKKVLFYSCGPTVYNYAHIGNLRSFIFSDILKKYLKYRGYEVKHVMNITDVDDKTIKNSRAEGKTLKEFTEFYTKEFWKDFEMLGIDKPDVIPIATEYIPEMVELIKKLLDKGVAYKGDDGSIYFNIKKFPEYGKLSHMKMENLKVGARIQHDEYDKENLSDFALWKAWNEEDGDVFWETEIGKGRPGWHIECSAMSSKNLGDTFDIHTGGVDLVFPHHENEIAQSESASGKEFVKYWMHCEHLIVDGKKMSKSLGNFYTLRDLLDKGLEPLAIRYVLLSTHYKQQLNFTIESVSAAKNSITRLHDFMRSMKEISDGGDPSNPDVEKAISAVKDNFKKEMDDNLNISAALGAVFEFVKEINKFNADGKVSGKDSESVISVMEEFDSVLGLMKVEEESLSPELMKMIDDREAARKGKDFATADKLRDELKEKGIILEDSKHGIRWKRI